MMRSNYVRYVFSRLGFVQVTFCFALTPEQLMLTVGESYPYDGLHVLQNKQLFHCFNTWSRGVQCERERFTGVFIFLSQIVWMISFLFLANINTGLCCRGLMQERWENRDLFLSPNVSCKYLQFLNGYFKMCSVYWLRHIKYGSSAFETSNSFFSPLFCNLFQRWII